MPSNQNQKPTKKPLDSAQTVSAERPNKNNKNKSVVLWVIFSVFWVLLFLVIGNEFGLFNNKSQNPITPSNVGIPNINPITNSVTSNDNVFRKEYDLMVVTVEKPHKIVALDFYETTGAQQNFVGNIHYYDGTSWQNYQLNESQINVQETSSLKQYSNIISAQINAGRENIRITIPEILTPVTIRAEEQFTKFAGATPNAGNYIYINSQPYQSYAAFLKGFHTNPPSSFDIFDLGLDTNWLMYFDENWNFYHLDKTVTVRKADFYPDHEVFVRQLRPDFAFNTAELSGFLNSSELAFLNPLNFSSVVHHFSTFQVDEVLANIPRSAPDVQQVLVTLPASNNSTNFNVADDNNDSTDQSLLAEKPLPSLSSPLLDLTTGSPFARSFNYNVASLGYNVEGSNGGVGIYLYIKNPPKN